MDNDKYCKKENNYNEWGEFVTQGKRSDLEDIKKMVDDGKKKKDIWENHFGSMSRYYKGVYEYMALVAKENTKEFRKVNCEYIYGKTGTGKTRYATNKFDDYYLIHGNNLNWFQDYEGEKCLVIDEYNNNLHIDELLTLLDGYQRRLNVKGSHSYANWTEVIITSNLTPKELHSNAKEEHRNALFRRLNIVREKLHI